ncbi:MAG: zinc ribbon domain-containing protein [Candidatus Sifarchaeia archaeon]
MTDRPQFLTVSYSDSGLSTMSYERKMVREKDVKFDGEDGSLEVTDVRLVWYKKPSGGGWKKWGALAGAVAGAALLEGAGRQMGGIGGHVTRSLARGITYAAVGTAISSWTADSYYNKDKDGNTESLALPLIVISQASQSGERLIVELRSGGTMEFHFKQKKVIPSILANVVSAQEQGKCPYCGTNAGNVPSCPNCGGIIEGGAGGAQVYEDSGAHVGADDFGGAQAGFCRNCGTPYPQGARFCNSCGQRL